jgi:hypothetical protein
MEPPLAPSTPQHRPAAELQLLTPPPSGGLDKRFTFAEEVRVDEQPKVNERSQVSAQLPIQSLSVVQDFEAGYFSPVVRVRHPALTEDVSITHFANDDPFDFTGLPIAIRRQVYKLLLTASGIVCVRQKRTPGGYEPKAYICADDRQLRPGISFVLVQATVNGLKSRFSGDKYVNAAILRVSKSVHMEAKQVLYGANTFEFSNLTKETAPPVDFRVPLFPRGYPRLLRKIVMRAKSLYGFQYLLQDGGYSELKNIYRNLEEFTIVLEIDKIDKGMGKRLRRFEIERYDNYVDRVFYMLKLELFSWAETSKTIPAWIQMKVLFPGDSYFEDVEESDIKKKCLKKAVQEAFDRLKQGGRK